MFRGGEGGLERCEILRDGHEWDQSERDQEVKK